MYPFGKKKFWESNMANLAIKHALNTIWTLYKNCKLCYKDCGFSIPVYWIAWEKVVFGIFALILLIFWANLDQFPLRIAGHVIQPVTPHHLILLSQDRICPG